MSSLADGVDLNDPASSTAICILASAAAGTGIGFFGCVLSYADKLRVQNGDEHSKRSKQLQVFGAVGSSIFGIASLVGLFFGPVSLVVVVRAGSTLPANAFFSHAFGLRELIREDILGTLVTVTAVICFAVFQGAGTARLGLETLYFDIVQPEAIFFIISMFVLFSGSLVLAFIIVRQSNVEPDSKTAEVPASTWVRLTSMQPSSRQFFLSVCVTNVASTSSAFMDLMTKAWSAHLSLSMQSVVSYPLFWVAIFLNVFFLVTMRIGMIYGCTKTDTMVFVPMNTSANIIYSASLGMVVLREYVAVSSWLGLSAAFVSLLCGIFLLIAGPSGFADGDVDSDLQNDGYIIDGPLRAPALSLDMSLGNLELTRGSAAEKDRQSLPPSEHSALDASSITQRLSVRAAEFLSQRAESIADRGSPAQRWQQTAERKGVTPSKPLTERDCGRRTSNAGAEFRNEKRMQTIFDLQTNSTVALTQLNRAQARQAARRHEVEDVRKELHEMVSLLRLRRRANEAEATVDELMRGSGSATARSDAAITRPAHSSRQMPFLVGGRIGEEEEEREAKSLRRFTFIAPFNFGWLRPKEHVGSQAEDEAAPEHKDESRTPKKKIQLFKGHKELDV